MTNGFTNENFNVDGTLVVGSTINNTNIGITHVEGAVINCFSNQYSASMADDGYISGIGWTKANLEGAVFLFSYVEVGGANNVGSAIVYIDDNEGLRVDEIGSSAGGNIIENLTPNWTAPPTNFSDTNFTITQGGVTTDVGLVNRLGFTAIVKLLQIM